MAIRRILVKKVKDHELCACVRVGTLRTLHGGVLSTASERRLQFLVESSVTKLVVLSSHVLSSPYTMG